MSVTIVLTAAAVGVAGIAVAGAAVAGRGGPVDRAAVLVAALVTGLLGVPAAIAVLVVPGLGVFAAAHIGYLLLVVTLPLVGVGIGVLARARGAASRSVWAVVVVGLLPAPVGVYATHVEPRWLRTDRIEVPVASDRAGDDPVTVGVLADLQTTGVGDHERRAVRELMDAEPDLILVPGDLFQAELTPEARAEMRALLGRLQAPAGVYFVQGDADGTAGGPADQILDGLAITTLADEVVEVEVGDRTLRIGGTALLFDTPAAQAVKDDLDATPGDGAITILVSHRPDTIFGLPDDSRVDLTVAGHTHGGQIVAPVIGPLATLSQVPRDVARGGLGEVGGNPIYVSPGVGMERGPAPQVRFLSRPAIGLLTLADA